MYVCILGHILTESKKERKKNHRALSFFFAKIRPFSLITAYCKNNIERKNAGLFITSFLFFLSMYVRMYVIKCSSRGNGGAMCPTIYNSNVSVVQIGKGPGTHDWSRIRKQVSCLIRDKNLIVLVQYLFLFYLIFLEKKLGV